MVSNIITAYGGSSIDSGRDDCGNADADLGHLAVGPRPLGFSGLRHRDAIWTSQTARPSQPAQ